VVLQRPTESCQQRIFEKLEPMLRGASKCQLLTDLLNRSAPNRHEIDMGICQHIR